MKEPLVNRIAHPDEGPRRTLGTVLFGSDEEFAKLAIDYAIGGGLVIALCLAVIFPIVQHFVAPAMASAP